jgi:hypothetical protein
MEKPDPPPIKKTLKSQPAIGKVMLITLFWDLQE